MNENKQPRLPEVDRFIRKTKFLKFMRLLDTFAYVYENSEAEDLRSKLERLEEGKKLLNHKQEIAFCEDLIKRYRFFLYGDPDELVEEHASFLRDNLELTTS